MQNKFKFDQYYKQLEKIQKTFNQSPNQKHKTYLKNKSQFSIKTIKNESNLKKDHQNYKNLKTSHQKHKNNTSSLQKNSPKDIPLKYLEDIQQSFISKNGPENSILTQQQNEKIVLEIYGFDSKEEDQQITVKNNNKTNWKEKLNSNKKSLEYEKQEKKEIIEIKTENKFIDGQKITEEILQNLKQRNRVYEKIQNKCKQNNHLDLEFEKMWKRYHLYEKFINNLGKLKEIK